MRPGPPIRVGQGQTHRAHLLEEATFKAAERYTNVTAHDRA